MLFGAFDWKWSLDRSFSLLLLFCSSHGRLSMSGLCTGLERAIPGASSEPSSMNLEDVDREIVSFNPGIFFLFVSSRALLVNIEIYH